MDDKGNEQFQMNLMKSGRQQMEILMMIQFLGFWMELWPQEAWIINFNGSLEDPFPGFNLNTFY